jgi:hypothetical protein
MALACREDRAMLEKSLKRLAGFCKKVRGKGGCRLPFFLFGELKRLIPGFGAEPQGSILMCKMLFFCQLQCEISGLN